MMLTTFVAIADIIFDFYNMASAVTRQLTTEKNTAVTGRPTAQNVPWAPAGNVGMLKSVCEREEGQCEPKQSQKDLWKSIM